MDWGDEETKFNDGFDFDGKQRRPSTMAIVLGILAAAAVVIGAVLLF
jgi:hypothetical protein